MPLHVLLPPHGGGLWVQLASASADKSVKVWNLSTLKCAKTIKIGDAIDDMVTAITWAGSNIIAQTLVRFNFLCHPARLSLWPSNALQDGRVLYINAEDLSAPPKVVDGHKVRAAPPMKTSCHFDFHCLCFRIPGSHWWHRRRPRGRHPCNCGFEWPRLHLEEGRQCHGGHACTRRGAPSFPPFSCATFLLLPTSHGAFLPQGHKGYTTLIAAADGHFASYGNDQVIRSGVTDKAEYTDKVGAKRATSIAGRAACTPPDEPLPFPWFRLLPFRLLAARNPRAALLLTLGKPILGLWPPTNPFPSSMVAPSSLR